MVSIVIPVLNEEKRIGRTLDSIFEFMRTAPFSYEILIVDDGSTDMTKDVVSHFTRKSQQVRFVSLGSHQGKGAAVKCGMLHAVGDLRLFMDADGSTDISEISKLIPYIEKGYDVVVGSRTIAGAQIVKTQPIAREFLGALFRMIVALVVPTGIRDTQNGFKLFSKKAAETIFPSVTVEGWCFDLEVLALAKKRNLQIVEVPIRWSNDAESRFRILDSLTMLRDLKVVARQTR